MKREPFVFFMTVALAFGLVACSDDSNQIESPVEPSQSTGSPEVLAKGIGVEMAAGSVQYRPRGQKLCTMTLEAIDVQGACKGQWQAHDRDINVKIHLNVMHLDVEGNQAFIVGYGMLPETPWYGKPTLGYGIQLVTDNGQGIGVKSSDQVSWWAIWPDTDQMPWAFVTSSLANATVSQAKAFLTNPDAFGWQEGMLYVPVERGNLLVKSR